MLRGPYESLDDSDLQGVFNDPQGGFYNDDHGSDDSAALAAALPPMPGFPDKSRYTVTGSLASTTDTDFYSILAPQSDSGTVTLTTIVRSIGPNGTTPAFRCSG